MSNDWRNVTQNATPATAAQSPPVPPQNVVITLGGLGAQQPHGKGFYATAALTVAVALGGLAMALQHFKKPEPLIIEKEVVVEKPVEVEKLVVREVPKVVEVEKLVVKEVPAPLPPPVEAKLATKPLPGPFDGVWSLSTNKLPWFRLHQVGERLTGEYAPVNYTGTYAIANGRVRDDVAEFTVTDQIGQRVHFRTKLLPDGLLKAENWITGEDAMRMVNIAGKGVRNGKGAAKNRGTFAPLLPKVGIPQFLGNFRLVPDPDRDGGM